MLPWRHSATADLKRAVGAGPAAAAKPPKSRPATLPPSNRSQRGSVRRLLALQEGGGLALQSKIDKLFSSLPAGDLQAPRTRSRTNLRLPPLNKNSRCFTSYFSAPCSVSSRLRLRGTARRRYWPGPRLIGPARLATFAGLWETLARDKADAPRAQSRPQGADPRSRGPPRDCEPAEQSSTRCSIPSSAAPNVFAR